jgi:uncharacterized membrane protein YvbJ
LKFCPNCGRSFEGDLVYCQNCGAKLPVVAKSQRRSDTDRNAAIVIITVLIALIVVLVLLG